MKFEIKVKDVIIVALVLALAAGAYVRIARLEGTVQTMALIKTVNGNSESIQKIVEFLNGKPWAAPAVRPLPPPEAPKPK